MVITWMNGPGWCVVRRRHHLVVTSSSRTKRGFREVWIVADQSGEVLLQAVFWDSLEALTAAVRHETDCMDAAKVK